MSPPLETLQLAIGYGRGRRVHTLASRLDLRLEPGRLVGLLGRNGIGKSTLLRTLAGLQAPLAGRALADGDDLHALSPVERAKRLSLMLTDAPPPSMMTGWELAALGRLPHSDWLGKLSGEDRDAVDRALTQAGAADLADMQLRELSDGQRQKLMLARTLAQETRLILLDEPTAFLDLPHRLEIFALLKRLAQEDGRTILASTHELHLALEHCDALWLMSNGEVSVGAPGELAGDGSIDRAFGVRLAGVGRALAASGKSM